MYYPLDGSTPTASSTLYTGPITVSSSLTLKAIAVDRAGHTSSVYSYTYAIDTVVPVFSSAKVIGALLTLTYSESLDASSVPAPEAFSVVVSGSPKTPDTVTISGATVSLHLKVPVFTPDKVVLSYTPGTPKLQDPAGNAVAPITSYPVTNDTPLLGGG